MKKIHNLPEKVLWRSLKKCAVGVAIEIQGSVHDDVLSRECVESQRIQVLCCEVIRSAVPGPPPRLRR